MQVMFTMGVENACQGIANVTIRARIGLQGDMYVLGRASLLAEHWESMKAALESAGHGLRDSQCSCWTAAIRDKSRDEWTNAARALTAKILCSEGMLLLGSAG